MQAFVRHRWSCASFRSHSRRIQALSPRVTLMSPIVLRVAKATTGAWYCPTPWHLTLGVAVGWCLSDRQWLSARISRCELPFGQVSQGHVAEAFVRRRLELSGRSVHSQVRAHASDTFGSRSDVRIIDIVDSDGVFREIKTGSVRYTPQLVQQILKDGAILSSNSSCKAYVWEFFPGKNGAADVDPRILRLLEAQGMQCIIHQHPPDADSASTCIGHDSGHCEVASLTFCLSGLVQTMIENSSWSHEVVEVALQSAQVLKAIDAVPSAVFLLCLCAVAFLARDVKQVRARAPDTKVDCDRVLSRLDVVRSEFGAALIRPTELLAGHKCELLRELLYAVSEDLKVLSLRCKTRGCDGKAEGGSDSSVAALALCKAVLNAALMTFRLGCGCTAAASVDSAGATTLGAAENVDKSLLSLGSFAQCFLQGSVLRLRTFAGRLGEPCTIDITVSGGSEVLERLGDGSIFAAKGHDVLVCGGDSDCEVVLCSIVDVSLSGSGVIQVTVQCSFVVT